MLFIEISAKQKLLKWPGVSDFLYLLSVAVVWSTTRLRFVQPTGWLDLLPDQRLLKQLWPAAIWIVLRTAAAGQQCVIFVFWYIFVVFKSRSSSVFILWLHFYPFVGGYNATPATPQGYSQPVQGYGSSSYDSSTAAASSTSSNQTSYGGQASYGAQSAYPGYGQQPASAAPPRYWLNLFFTVPRSFAKVTNCNFSSSVAIVLAANSPLDMSRTPIPSSLSKTPILSNSREDTRVSKEATDSRAPTASREVISKLLPSSSRLHLPATPHLLGPMDSPLLANTDSRAALEEAMASQIINHPASMVSVLVVAWQRLSYLNEKAWVTRFSLTGNYSRDHQNGGGYSGPESGGYGGPGEGRGMGGGENRGRGRGGFDRGMMRGGGGMRGGMSRGGMG